MSEPPSDAPAEAPAESAAPPPDPAREALLRQLEADFGESLLGWQVLPGDLVVRVDPAQWRRAAETLKIKHGFEYFCFLSGIDWMRSPDLSTRYEQVFGAVEDDEAGDAGDAAASPMYDDRVAGGTSRFSVFLRVQNLTTGLGLTMKADLDDDRPSVESITPVYRGADWHERETWEMFGFDFVGHPGLRHIYLPSEFEGFPLRKDFPLLARAVKPWPGLVDKEPVPGEDDDEEVTA